MTVVAGAAVIGLFAMVSCSSQVTSRQRPRIKLDPCVVGPSSTPALCGYVSVPENRQTGRGRVIEIRFATIRGTAPMRDAFLMLAGGPGESSINVMNAFNWSRPVQGAMDVLLIDQRGSGASHPLICDPEVLRAPARAFGHVFDPAGVRRCRTALESNADLTQYTTDAAAEDIEAVRAELGYQHLSIYGASYGTRLAQAYMRRHPDRVKAVVLDGVVPVSVAVPLQYAASAQEALDRVFASCRERDACREAHPSPSDDFKRLLDGFDAGPKPATIRTSGGSTVPVMMSRGDFAYAVRGILYVAKDGATLPNMVGRALVKNDVSEFAQRYWDRVDAFSHGFADGLHWSIFCAEDIPFVTEPEIATDTAHTFLGRYLIDEYRTACAEWPRGHIRPDFRTPVAARVPTLLISGVFDPVTPPELADRVTRFLPLARNVVSQTTAHGSMFSCDFGAMLHFLTTGVFADMPTACE